MKIIYCLVLKLGGWGRRIKESIKNTFLHILRYRHNARPSGEDNDKTIHCISPQGTQST